jgi:hypothetical protein
MRSSIVEAFGRVVGTNTPGNSNSGSIEKTAMPGANQNLIFFRAKISARNQSVAVI